MFFWDANLPASEAVYFSLEDYTREHQLKIWFIDTMDYWLTVDKNCLVSIWDIADQERVDVLQIKVPSTACRVLDIAEIVHLRLIVIATSEKLMYIYSMDRLQLISTFYLDICGFNAMKYFESYQTLLVSGYENVVKVFTFTPGFNEINIVGRLVGHVGIIEGIEIINETAMVITADDKGTAKLWDIRKLTCVQTVKLENKSNINSVVHLGNQNRVLFVGDRLNSVEFESDLAKKKTSEKTVAIGFELVEDKRELYLATKSEVRVIDIQTGQVKSIFVNMIEKEANDEITCFKFLHKKNQFVLGNFNGVISFFNATTSEQVKANQPHTGSVSGIKLDEINDMVLSSSMDASLCLQIDSASLPIDQIDEFDDTAEREEYFGKPIMDQGNALAIVQGYSDTDKQEFTIKNTAPSKSLSSNRVRADNDSSLGTNCRLRTIHHCNADTEASIMEVSVYHNMVALANLGGRVYLYNYEHFRPAAVIDIEEGAEVVGLVFITGFCKLAVSSSTGCIHFFSVWQEGISQFTVTYDLRFTLHKNTYVDERRCTVKLEGFANRLVPDIGLVRVDENIPTKSSIDIGNSKQLMKVDERLKLECSDFFVAESSGVICHYDLEEYLQQEPTYKPFSDNSNYNQFRKVAEDFNRCTTTLDRYHFRLGEMIPKYDSSKLTGLHVKTFKAARESLTQLNVFNSSRKLLLLTSEDSTFRMFNTTGQMLCHLNLNHPLPIIWNFDLDLLVDFKSKLVFALKTVELISQRYNRPEHRSVISLRKVIDIYGGHDFSTFSMTSIGEVSSTHTPVNRQMPRHLRNNTINVLLDGQSPLNAGNTSRDRGDESTRSRRKAIVSQVMLMKDLFTPKDIAFEKIKAENREEIQGPTLKQLETIRRAKNVLKKSDPLYGEEMEAKFAAFAEEEKMKEQQKKLAKRMNMEYEDPILAEIRRKKISQSIATKIFNKFEAIDERIVLEASTPRVRGPIIARSSRQFNQQAIKIRASGTFKSRLSNRGLSLSSRRPNELSLGSVFTKLPPIEASLPEELQKPTPDFFDYASEKNLVPEDSASIHDPFRSKILHESSQLSQISNTLFSTERRHEKKHFQSILRNLDKKVLKSKTSHRDAHQMSQLSKGYPTEGESTVISSRVNYSKVDPSLSLPRLHK